jgi:hypothetical protein
MPLDACPECGGQVSVTANACPHCGHPLRQAPAPLTPPPLVRWPVLLFGLFVGGLGVYLKVTYGSLQPRPALVEELGRALGVPSDNDQNIDPKVVTPIAWVLIVLGGLFLIDSVTRYRVLAWCPRCNRQVIAKRSMYRWKCESCRGIARA